MSYNKLTSFLNKRRSKTNEKCTHISMGTEIFTGRFTINDNDLDYFYRLYNNALNDKHNLFIGEAKIEQGPIIVDIDMKYELHNESVQRIYKLDDIKKILDIYNRTILKYLDIDEDNFIVYILEKKTPSIIQTNEKKTQFKDGIHIIYPYICASTTLQLLIREVVIKNIEDEKILDYLNLSNSYNDIIDKNVITGNWLMYGSSKTIDENLKYKLTNVLNFNNDEIMPHYNNLVEILSVRKFKSKENINYRENYNEEEVIKQYDLIMNNYKKKIIHKISNNDIQICSNLIKILNPERANNYTQWIELGFCLKNIDNSLLMDWNEFSKQSNKYQAGECDKHWETFNKQGLGIGSLYRWAKQDNPEKYIELMMSEFDDIIINSLDGTSGKVAKVFYNLNKYNYICESISRKKMYEFIQHKWEPIDESTSIIIKLNDELSKLYLRLSKVLHDKALIQNVDERDKTMTKYKLANDISIKLCKMSYKKEIIAELLHMYYNKNFINLIDENRHLICFNNGVYDLKKLEFRDGRAEDYITLCTNTDYIPYDNSIPAIIQVEQFFEDVQPNKDLKNYLLQYIASCLSGVQREQLFPIWTGTGANGKGRTLKLALDSFGDYATTLNVSFLTQKKNSSSNANPELAKTKGKRLCVFQEPENTDKIYVGNMKSIVGGDKLEARKLYSEPFEFYPQFKTILACNKLPLIQSNDGGTWRRIRVIPFDIKFVSNPNPKNNYEKKSNNDIDELMPYWKSAFMSIIIEKYKEYIKNELKEPNEVLLQTKQYQNSSDVFQEYVNTNIKITEDENDITSVKEVYENYLQWLKEEKIFNDKLDRNSFKKEMSDKIIKPIKDKYYGIILRNIVDEQSENMLNSSIKSIDYSSLNKKNDDKFLMLDA